MKCNYTTKRGQCSKEAVQGHKFCEEHSPRSAQTLINQYRIACKVTGDAPERHSNLETLKSLRGEIALLRSLIETRFNMIESEAELVVAMPAIKDAIVAVEKLTTACHTMDVKLANLLDKNVLLSLANDLIEIIENTVRPLLCADTADRTIEEIGEKIIQAIAAKEQQ